MKTSDSVNLDSYVKLDGPVRITRLCVYTRAEPCDRTVRISARRGRDQDVRASVLAVMIPADASGKFESQIDFPITPADHLTLDVTGGMADFEVAFDLTTLE